MIYLILYLILEIAGFALVGKLIGVLATIGLVVLTTLIGVVFMRTGGISMKNPQQMAMADPKQAVRGFAGILLLIPGFITDLLGLLLFIPAVQRAIMRMLAKKMMNTFSAMQEEMQAAMKATQQAAEANMAERVQDDSGPQVIDGESERVDEK